MRVRAGVHAHIFVYRYIYSYVSTSTIRYYVCSLRSLLLYIYIYVNWDNDNFWRTHLFYVKPFLLEIYLFKNYFLSYSLLFVLKSNFYNISTVFISFNKILLVVLSNLIATVQHRTVTCSKTILLYGLSNYFMQKVSMKSSKA